MWKKKLFILFDKLVDIESSIQCAFGRCSKLKTSSQIILDTDYFISSIDDNCCNLRNSKTNITNLIALIIKFININVTDKVKLRKKDNSWDALTEEDRNSELKPGLHSCTKYSQCFLRDSRVTRYCSSTKFRDFSSFWDG